MCRLHVEAVAPDQSFHVILSTSAKLEGDWSFCVGRGSGIEGDSQKYFSAILVEHVWTSPLDHATDLFVFVDLG